ncbi:RNA polymerase subunit sigma-70 [Vibrio tarriae]|nr:RNA polymerase subunit sigma-70 [Vibrio tarriae]RBM35444.1 RNA polymerase subunit sigma-70 [Vibrio tarriae]RBM38879.1 RNA polymerase subunit sigma-70 [Vibrio tarriae]RBM41335.1 RNA polymerase subunit sigma-70 [Vibrio tarriae]RBM48525.1 RNA polymerase subunit sigma-70 [Vibrio tarriae]
MVCLKQPSIRCLLEAAVVLVTFVHPQSHSLSMLIGMNSLAAYLQLQVVWGY